MELKAKEVFPGVFSRHAAAYRDRVMARALRGRVEVIERVDPRPGERVLDLACGPGTLTLRLAELVGPSGEVVAADLAPGMLELVRDSAPANVQTRLMELEALDFPDASFDAVTCGHGYQFVTDLDRALAEAVRVLRPGGRFAASVPNGGASAGVRELIDSALAELPPAPEVVDREATLAVLRDAGRFGAALARAGLRDVRVTRHEEPYEFEDVTALTNQTFGWWDCAWRLEQVPAGERARIRDAFREYARSHVAQWPLRTTSYTLVASGRK